LAPARFSTEKAFQTPDGLLVQLQAQVAAGSRIDDSGKLCWTNKLVFLTQQDDPVISPPVVIVLPPPKVALPGLKPGPKETGRNVVILVCVLLPRLLPDASKARLGAEPPAPALSDDIREAAGLKEPYLEQGHC
jgi:hypothetical protein